MTEVEASVLVNGEPRGVPIDCTVEGLLTLLDLGERRVAVAVNRDVVPKSAYESMQLTGGDKIEILEAVGGG
jgi:sulfur carrier protein